MKLHDIFLKPIDRHIDGVIKADDERSLKNEIEEYVVTKELRRGISQFINFYLERPEVNGMWISGFFGSGKSHLLKMLALLMENRTIDGYSTLEMFLPKLEDDAMLRGNLERACTIPSKSILFNISQKANIVNKQRIDALLGTFIKVFDEMCGYYGKQGYIAQFERDLDTRGLLEQFKSEYQNVSGLEWEQGREQNLFESKNITEAYLKVHPDGNKETKDILKDYSNHYTMSIEDFAKMVDEYIKNQEEGFRLNFFVDEVGQYIADNGRLMIDLQTIAESLATHCNGRAWIIVTAQEEMSSIIGRLFDDRGTDFSKIQDRFKCKANLTSANVDEVIRLRLLAKKDEGKDLLDSLYLDQQNNLKMLFDLPDGAKKYPNYKSREHFVSSYPFVPYQFVLFQSSIQNLSKHDAFAGQYQSVGERSMLEVFQFVVKSIANREIGVLATFDLMFEGVRDVIKTNVVWGITQSEKMVEDEFTKRLLKVLFLVKYVKEFQATPRNLAVLLIDSFDDSPQNLQRRIEESLVALEQETYIKRDDNVYEYLTDKERDIEKEIKHVSVDQLRVSKQMSALFYASSLGLSKIRYAVNNQDFPFTQRLDNIALGREHELGIHIKTEDLGAENFRALSMQQHSELIVALPPDDQFYKENRLYLQTETYVNQIMSSAGGNEEKLILSEKNRHNQQRYEQLKRRAAELLGDAKMYVLGDDVPTELSDAKARVSFGFQRLIERVYPNLVMIGETHFSEKDIGKYLDEGKSFLSTGFETMGAAESEILSFVNIQKSNGVRVTMSSLVNNFERQPNGWSVAAILCLVARLYGMAKIEATLDKPLDEANFEKTIKNTALHNNIIITTVIDPGHSNIGRLRDLYSNVFHQPPREHSARSLAMEFASSVEGKYLELVNLRTHVETFPFLVALDPVLAILQRIKGKTYDWYYTNIGEFENELRDEMDDVVHPILSFIQGQEGSIYKQAKQFLSDQTHNLIYIQGEEKEHFKAILDNPSCFRTQRMREAKTFLEVLEDKLKRKLKSTKSEALKDLEKMKDRLSGMQEFESLEDRYKNEIEEAFIQIQGLLNSNNQIALVNDQLRQFEENTYARLIGKIQEWGSVMEPLGGLNDNQDSPKSMPRKVISMKEIDVPFNKVILYDEHDIEKYVQSLAKALLSELEKGHIIQV